MFILIFMLKKTLLIIGGGLTLFIISYISITSSFIDSLFNKENKELSKAIVLSETIEKPALIISVTPSPTPIIKNEYCSVNCIDCINFPVSKINSLRSDYSPEVVNINLNGGGKLIKSAFENLEKLFAEAKAQGLNPRIVSSYRSYQTQVGLFESYVQKEVNRYKTTRARAEEIANVYSARPGHSEHQLGTTVDITCDGCTPFASDINNQKIYEFLKQNVSRFGFVVSYTKENTNLTGYKPEPWHIRYVGKEIAEKYYVKYNELQRNYSLDQFLSENCPE